MPSSSNLLCDPAVLGDPKRINTLNRERTQLAPIVETFSAVPRRSSGRSPTIAKRSPIPSSVRIAREELPGLETNLSELEQKLQLLLLPRDPNDDKNTLLEIRARHGRRGGGALRGRPVSHVLALRGAPGLARRDHEPERRLGRGAQGGHRARHRRARLLAAQARGRRASRAARAGDRSAGTHPHVDGDGRGAARGGRGRLRDRREGPALRHRRVRRPRRPGREHDEQRRADHAPADRHDRQVPGRAQPAQEQREGAEDPEEPLARHRARKAGRRGPRRTPRHGEGRAIARRRSAPTTSRRTA